MNTIELVNKANGFLGSVKTFEKENVEKLRELKEKMEGAGFDAPFKAVLARTQNELEGMDEGEWEDLKKQMSYFRYLAQMKKYTFARVGIAFYANKLAEGFSKKGYDDILFHLPLDGNHITPLIKTGNTGIIAYRTLMDRFELLGENVPEFSVKVEKDDVTYTIKVKEKENIEKTVERIFGKETYIEDIRTVMKRKSIISSKKVRLALINGIVKYTWEGLNEELTGEERGELKKYNEFLREKGFIGDARMDLAEGFADMKKKLEKKGFLKKTNEGYKLKEEVRKEIEKRKRVREREVLKRANALLLGPLFKHYLIKNKEERKKKNLYPTLAIKPSSKHLRIFNFFDEVDTEIDVYTILIEKLRLEEKNLGIAGKELGAGLLKLRSKKSTAWISNYLKIDKKKVESAAAYLSSLEKGGKGDEFLRTISR
ncbi:DUF530 family protein [Candidatus Micrarchaeota archaeon]|nr:DUF530 family protein [Candidatus Micrarchaeota archaeon]